MSDKLRAEWFWTDRWRSSSGFLLPMEARGLYREMLTAAWTLGAWLPNDHEQIRLYTGCLPEVWERCWPLIEAKWKQEGSKLVNETQRQIFNECLTLSEKRALAGACGGKASGKARSKRQANAEATPQANPQQTNPPSPSPSKTPARKQHTYSAVFERLWDEYPKHRRKAKQNAYKVWKRTGCDEIADEIMAGLARWNACEGWMNNGGQFVPNAKKWIEDEWWDTEPDAPSTAPLTPLDRQLERAEREAQLREMLKGDPERVAYAQDRLRQEGYDAE